MIVFPKISKTGRETISNFTYTTISRFNIHLLITMNTQFPILFQLT